MTRSVTMSTWDRATLSAVQRFYVKGTIEADLMGRASVEDVGAALCEGAFIAGVQALAVDVHRGDIGYHIADSDQPFKVSVIAMWQPKTTAIELRGGSNDGRTLQFDRAGRDTYRAPMIQGLPNYRMDEPMSPTAPAFRIETYEPAGWNETRRTWIYDLKPD